MAIGARDLKEDMIEVARRDTKEKNSVSLSGLEDYVIELLKDIQKGMFEKALNFREEHITDVSNFEEFKEVLESKGGFIRAHWDGSAETEDKIKELTKATIRCIPLDEKPSEGVCVYTGKPSTQRVLFAKAY